MDKVRVIVKKGVTPFQVDNFAEGCARSCVGSLRIQPGLVEMSADEWTHISSDKKMKAGLSLHSRVAAPKAGAQPVAVAPVSEPAQPPAQSEDADGTGESEGDDSPETSKQKRLNRR